MAASAELKSQTKTTKTKRRRRRETTISTSAETPPSEEPPSHPTLHRKLETPTVVEDRSWCCSTAPPPPVTPLLSKHPSSPRRPISAVPTQLSCDPEQIQIPESPFVTVTISSPLPSQLAMRISPAGASPLDMERPSEFCSSAPYSKTQTKFNTALNAGLLNPMSPPPPPPPLPMARSSPTLFEMMTKEQDYIPISQIPPPDGVHMPALVSGRHILPQERNVYIPSVCSPGNHFNDSATSDLKLILRSKEGLSVSVNVHREILVAHSRFFAGKLSDRWSRHLVEISDCDDVEIYMETLMLMYCNDLRKRLMRADVPKVLAILKVCTAIAFDAGVLSCLEYLEAAPWAEDEDEKVASLLSQLRLESAGAGEVLKRVSVEKPFPGEGNKEILTQLLEVILQGKDEKARREMKGLVSKMLRENASQNELNKDSLYLAYKGCLEILRTNVQRVAGESNLSEVSEIARQADNLDWILDVLIDHQVADEFLETWASETELAKAHSKIPPIHRYEVSRVSSRLFVGIGKGQILASKELRYLLLQTWLEPFYGDFGWMRRAYKGLDRHLIEEGLGNTILTLPIDCQQEILLSWFDRFLNSGEDCPNLQRAFEVWWRRAFWRRKGEGDRQHIPNVAVKWKNSC